MSLLAALTHKYIFEDRTYMQRKAVNLKDLKNVPILVEDIMTAAIKLLDALPE